MKSSNEFSYDNPPGMPPVGSAAYAACTDFQLDRISPEFLPTDQEAAQPLAPEESSGQPNEDIELLVWDIDWLFNHMRREEFELQDMQEKLSEAKAAKASEKEIKELEAAVAELNDSFKQHNVVYDKLNEELQELVEQERKQKELSIG